MAAPELRPMGIGDILDVTFRLYRRRFLTFLLIALAVYVPYALLSASIQPFEVVGEAAISPEAMTQHGQVDASALQRQLFRSLAVRGLTLAVFVIVLFPLCSAALVHNISASYLGEELTAGQSYSRAARRLPALIGTQFLAGILILVGFLLCIVPGIIFSLWFCALVPVVLLECKAGPTAMGRSRELARGNLDKAFSLGVVVGLLTWIIAFGMGFVLAMVPWPHPTVHLFVANLVQAVLIPIQTAPWILLYYDLRIRKEAFDLQMLSESLGQPASGGPAAT